MHEIIKQYFEEYTTMSEASHTAVIKIAERESIKMDRIILATSFCFDELNHHQAKMKLPSEQGTFIMGGLAGYPFVGEIGWRCGPVYFWFAHRNFRYRRSWQGKTGRTTPAYQYLRGIDEGTGTRSVIHHTRD